MGNKSLEDAEKAAGNVGPHNATPKYGDGEDILSLQDTDPGLAAKMYIVNNVSKIAL